jgi:hypothetical protein
MNLKCRIISNIKIYNFFIIHVAIGFSENFTKNMDEFFLKNGFIVDFWNDDTMFVTHKKKKLWTQKICHNNIKIKNKKIGHHKMNKSIVRCIDIFPIYIYSYLKV